MCKATLLIFRHCCLEIGLWSEYSRWYSSYKLNLDIAKVFYSLLTKLLPDDLPAALASHINTVITFSKVEDKVSIILIFMYYYF